MRKNILKALDIIQENLESQIKKLEYLRENTAYIEYWDPNGEGRWKPFTEEMAIHRKWNVDDLRVNRYYLVNTNNGILLLDKKEYETYRGETHVLCVGSYQDCKNYIKVK